MQRIGELISVDCQSANLMTPSLLIQGGSMKTFAVLFLVLSSVQSAFALPVNTRVTLEEIQALTWNSSSAYDFEGIVKLDNCSGSLVRFEHSKDSDKGMVMTNGHCVPTGMFGGFIKPGEHLIRKPVKRSFRFLNRDGSLSQNSVVSTQILFATMTGTDVALYELELSYTQIKTRFDVDALTLDANRPREGEAIEILSGYWQRGYSCQIDGFVFKMKEDAYTWLDSIRYSRSGCKTIGGTSGSPILSVNTRKVIGVNNTGSEDGKQCTMNNPCEVSADGAIYAEKGLSYGQQTYRFYSCLNADGALDVRVRGCALVQSGN